MRGGGGGVAWRGHIFYFILHQFPIKLTHPLCLSVCLCLCLSLSLPVSVCVSLSLSPLRHRHPPLSLARPTKKKRKLSDEILRCMDKVIRSTQSARAIKNHVFLFTAGLAISLACSRHHGEITLSHSTQMQNELPPCVPGSFTPSP